jgi:hypothetical protein
MEVPMSECLFNGNAGVQRLIHWLGIIAISTLASVNARAQPSPSPSKRTIDAILTDPALWGKDFPAALASLQSWPEAGERSVLIFQNRIVGGTALKTREEAETKSKKVTEVMATKEFRPKPGFEAMFKDTAPRLAAALKTEVMLRFQDDDSVRVAATSPEAHFLAPNLTVATVQKQLGTPQKVEQQVIQSEGDRRPVVLTLYRYADGAVTFAESDIAAVPGAVDRVLLDAPAVMNAIQAR